MVIVGALMAMFGVAFIIAIPLLFSAEFRNAVIAAIIGSCLLLGGAGTVEYFKPPIQYCTVAQNSTVLWRSFSGERNATHHVYFAAPNGTFCLVEDAKLYDMGLGYKTSQTYQGIIIHRP